MLLVSAAVVALKLPVVKPAPTVTVPGTVSANCLLLNPTTAPPAGAPPLSVTMHTLVAFAPRLAGLHASVDTTGRLPPVTTPPAGEIVIAPPEAEDAMLLLIPTVVVGTPEAVVTFTTASVPFDMMLAFMPEASHV